MKIMIIGRPGCGKSTFARHLQAKWNLPLYHLDKYFYEANWVERNYAEFIQDQVALIKQKAWIIDGNCTKSFELRYQQADYCLYFNMPKWLCYYRVYKRLLLNNRELSDKAAGCKEAVRWSLIKYMWGYSRRVDAVLSELQKKYPAVKFMEVNNDAQTDALLEKINLLNEN